MRGGIIFVTLQVVEMMECWIEMENLKMCVWDNEHTTFCIVGMMGFCIGMQI